MTCHLDTKSTDGPSDSTMPIEEKETQNDLAVIVIPTHNEHTYIGGLLDSIERYAPRNSQVIVVDNGSTDETPTIALARGVTVIRLPSRVFPGVARNIGIKSSDPERDLVVFLDADVELTPEWQAEWLAQVDSLKTNPLQLTGATYEISRNPSWLERVWFAPMRLREKSYIPGGNIITTRTLFHSLGGFDIRLQTGEDVDFCARARRLGASVLLNSQFKVHHEGFPKNVAHFLKRERWHGSGDLTTLQRAIKSRVVLATSLFVLLHAAGITAAIWAAANSGNYLTTGVCAFGIVLLCAVGAARAVGASGRPPGVSAMAVMYIYYVGRALSLWDALRRMLPSRRTRNEHPTRNG